MTLIHTLILVQHEKLALGIGIIQLDAGMSSLNSIQINDENVLFLVAKELITHEHWVSLTSGAFPRCTIPDLKRT